MIESKKFKETEEEFNRFKSRIKGENEYKQKICYLFEQGLENTKKGHLEIALFLFCVIIESIASRRKYESYKRFDEWLIEDESERFNKFISEIRKTSNPKKTLQNWHKQYRETYGPRKNFIEIIMETYDTLRILPSFMGMKTKKIKGVETSIPRKPEEFKNIDKLKKEFKHEIGEIYDKYRSPFAHQGKFLSSKVIIQTTIGGMSYPGGISLQDIMRITLNVMKVNLTSDEVKND